MRLNMVKKLLYTLLVLGAIDALYLTAVWYNGSLLYCPAHGVINCAGVLGSQYSAIGGVPVAVLGLVLFVLAPFMILKNSDTLIFLWSIAGAGAVVYSISSMALLGEVCEYCIILDTIILLTIITTYLRVRRAPLRGMGAGH